MEKNEKLSLAFLNVVTGTATMPSATVEIGMGDKVLRGHALGAGPVAAVISAIRKATGKKAPSGKDRRFYHLYITSLAIGEEVIGEATCVVDESGRKVTGRGEDRDVLVAVAKAYLDALNSLSTVKGK